MSPFCDRAGGASRSVRLLAAGVAAGFGVLGWLAAQVVTLYVLGHGHAADGHAFRHVHGYAAPIGLAASAMVAASLVALVLIAGPAGRAGAIGPRSPVLVSVLAPSAAFAVLEIGDAVRAGAALGPAVLGLVLGTGLQAAAGAAAALLARTCVELALTPVGPLTLTVSVPACPGRRGPVFGVVGGGWTRWGHQPPGVRGPPLPVGF